MISWILASLWNHMELGQTEHAHALTGIALAAVDQWMISGRLDFGYLWTHLEEPPWNVIERGPRSSHVRPYSRLAPAAWVATTVAYLRDMDALRERMGPPPAKATTKATPPTDPPGPGAGDPPKAPGGRRRGGKAGGAPGAPA